MPNRVKWYLIFWVITIIIILLTMFSKFYNYLRWRSETGKKMMIPSYRWPYFGDLPEERPSFNWSFKNIIKSLFILFIVFLIGLIIVYYNFFGLGDIFYTCPRHDIDCKINAIKNSFTKEDTKQSKSTSGKKSSVSKVVKTKTSVPSRRNHR